MKYYALTKNDNLIPHFFEATEITYTNGDVIVWNRDAIIKVIRDNNFIIQEVTEDVFNANKK